MPHDLLSDDFFGQRVLGIDEAGRGPLAGPVVAAGVILNNEAPIKGLKDSKKLSKIARQHLDQEIKERALFVTVHAIDSKTIDETNILEATMLAMKRVIMAIEDRDVLDAVIIDGNRTVKGIPGLWQIALVNGDNRLPCIMAASIVAKVHRDRLMSAYHEQFPGYGFDQHVGYGTEQHLEALIRLGPCPIHRHSFAPLKRLSRG